MADEERIRMPAHHPIEEPLLLQGGALELAELEAIAAAAADEPRVLMDESREGEQAPRSAVPDAASAAIAAGMPLAAIADAERVGQTRARHELGSDILRRVARAARRKRETDDEYEHTIVRATRIGLPHRDIAAAAQVAHGTVRAIAGRGDGGSADPASRTAPQNTNG